MAQLILTRLRDQLFKPGAETNFCPPRGSSNAPAPPRGRAADRAQASSKARAPRDRAPSGSPLALRRERCGRENTRAAGPDGDVLTSDSAQLPATSAIASAFSRASLLQEVHTVHQEPVSDQERQFIFWTRSPQNFVSIFDLGSRRSKNRPPPNLRSPDARIEETPPSSIFGA